MLVGHYSAAFFAKGLVPRVPLWMLLLAAQLVDVAWALLVLLGVERVRLDPRLASNPLDLYHMPYTHSLAGGVLFAAAAGVLAARQPRLGGTRGAGLAVGAVVLSHWFLDLVVHRPDLTLFGAPPKLGLALWNRPLLAFALELGLLAASLAFYSARCAPGGRARRVLAGWFAVFAVLETSVTFGTVPPSVPVLAASVLALFLIVAWAGERSERSALRAPA